MKTLWMVLALSPLGLAAQAGGGGADVSATSATPRVVIAGGRFTPQFVVQPGPVAVAPFLLDVHPVTVAQYRAFLEANPRWRRSAVPEVFAGRAYLESWSDDLDPGTRDRGLLRPVTEVTWFAARAYCGWRDGRLPSVEEWEYAAAAGLEGESRSLRHRRTLARTTSRPGPRELGPVASSEADRNGVWDLHGLVWEWVADFNSQMATGAGRDDKGLDRRLFCAAGSSGATDVEDYAAFLRYAFRTSLSGGYAGRGLGFRCAADLDTDERVRLTTRKENP